MIKKLLLLTILICFTLTGISYGYGICKEKLYIKVDGKIIITHPFLERILVLGKSDNETKEEQVERVVKSIKVVKICQDNGIEMCIKSHVQDIKGSVYVIGWSADKRNDQTYLIGYWITKDNLNGFSTTYEKRYLVYKNPRNKNTYLIGWLFEINIATETVQWLAKNQELQNAWNLAKPVFFYPGMKRLTPEEEKKYFGKIESNDYRKNEREKTIFSDNGLIFNIVLIIGLIFCIIPWWGWLIIILIILVLYGFIFNKKINKSSA